MLRSSTLLCSVLLAMCGLPHCAEPLHAADPERPDSKVIPVAEKFAAQFFDRKFDEAVTQFDSTMSAALPAAKLHDLLTTLEKQMGPLKDRGMLRVEVVQEFEVVFIPCHFEKQSLDMKVVVDGKQRVTGLFFVPATVAVEWKAPKYVIKDRFEEKPIEVVTKSPDKAGLETREWRLPGFLTLPKGAGPFPAVVLVHGSGPNDADETIGPNKPFKDLAWGLASRGVAVLRYVKRTNRFGKELAAAYPQLTAREELEEDAGSAVQLLRQSSQIDPKRVCLLGHSLGGQMAPRIARNTRELAGIVILAGNTRPLESLIVDQLRYIANIDGKVTAEEQAQIDAAIKAAEVISSPDLKDSDQVEVLGAKVPGSYFLDLRAYDAVATAKALSIRILILQGESDYQVTMEDFAGWQHGLANKPQARLKSFAAINHLLMPIAGKSTPENTLAPGHVDGNVIDEIATWITEPVPKGGSLNKWDGSNNRR